MTYCVWELHATSIVDHAGILTFFRGFINIHRHSSSKSLTIQYNGSGVCMMEMKMRGKLYFLASTLLSALTTRFARPTMSPSKSSAGSSGGACRKRSGDLAMRVTESTISDVLAIFDTSSGSIHSNF